MPQMAPIMWTSLFLTIIFLVLAMTFLLYFKNSITYKSNIQHTTTANNFSWPW